jgi:hypothetical protein
MPSRAPSSPAPNKSMLPPSTLPGNSIVFTDAVTRTSPDGLRPLGAVPQRNADRVFAVRRKLHRRVQGIGHGKPGLVASSVPCPQFELPVREADAAEPWPSFSGRAMPPELRSRLPAGISPSAPASDSIADIVETITGIVLRKVIGRTDSTPSRSRMVLLYSARFSRRAVTRPGSGSGLPHAPVPRINVTSSTSACGGIGRPFGGMVPFATRSKPSPHFGMRSGSAGVLNGDRSRSPSSSSGVTGQTVLGRKGCTDFVNGSGDGLPAV